MALQSSRQVREFRTVILLVIVGILAVFAIVRIAEYQQTPSAAGPLAECLTQKGVKMYGAYWCPHCAAQKRDFGSAFSKVTYVECAIPGDNSAQTQACKDAGIKSYPTWIFPDGSRVSGEQSLADLAEKAGCPWNTNQ